MAARSVKKAKAKPPRPEDVVEAALQTFPAKGPVLEVLTSSPSQVAKALATTGVRLSEAELEAELVDAGLHLHGSPAARRKTATKGLQILAKELAKALQAGAPVFSVHSAPGPTWPGGGLDLAGLRGLGLGAEGATLDVGGAAWPGLVCAGLTAWRRGPGRRARADALWLVVGGSGALPAAAAWQPYLQRVADETQLVLHVRHLPAAVARWVRVLAPVARVDSVAPDGTTRITTLCRVYNRRPPTLAPPVRIDVAAARPAEGPRRVRAEGQPASRCYAVRPRG